MTNLLDLLFICVAFALPLGSLILRIFNTKKAQLAFTVETLAILSILAAIELVTVPHLIFNVIAINPFSVFFILIMNVGMALVNIIAFSFSENYGDFALLSNFALLGMYFVAGAGTLINIFIGLELASLPAVFMILLSKRSVEAATKFFIMTSVAVAVLSLAIVLFYGASNTLSLVQAGSGQLLIFAALLFIISLGIDSSIFPFNLLIPDVYEGSPSPVTAMLGGINKKAGFAALLQVLIFCFIAYKSAFFVIAVLSVLTMFYGTLAALRQDNIKRLFAYSSISQAGYILIGIATQAQAGVAASLFLIFSHMFAFIGLFAIIAWLESRHRTKIEDLSGLNNENRFAALALSIFILSFIGVPLTTGFVGKFLVFLNAVNSNLAWLAILGIISTIISIYYYAKVLMAVYSSKRSKPLPLPGTVKLVLVVTIGITLILGIYPQLLTTLTGSAASYLFSLVK